MPNPPIHHPLPNDGRTRMCVVCYTRHNHRRPAVSVNYRGHAVCAEHETMTAPEIHKTIINNKH